MAFRAPTKGVAVMGSPTLNELLELAGPVKANHDGEGKTAPEGDSSSLQKMLRAALGAPVGLESIRHVLVPGDRVVVAVSGSVPRLAELMDLLRQELQPVVAGSEELVGTVEFLVAPAALARMKESGQPIRVDEAKGVVLHDPAEPADHALLATGCDDEPLQINRRLFDADVVVLMTSRAGEGTPRQEPADVFPQFGSVTCQENQRRQKPSHAARDRALVDRHLGIDFEIVVQTQPGGAIAGLLCGLRQPSDAAAEQRIASTPDEPPAGNAKAVVATIETPSSGSVWQEFEQALRVADERAFERAPVVVWSRIGELPDPRHAGHFRHGFDREESGRVDDSDDSLAAILGRRPVYLCSQLDQADVEELGLGHVGSIRELRHLLESTGPPLLIRDAHLQHPARTANREENESDSQSLRIPARRERDLASDTGGFRS